LGLADPPPHLIAAGQTDPGQRRGLNEDAWRIADESDLGDMIEERGQLFAVADGMGGHAAGEVASELAIETLFAEYYGRDDAPMSPAMRLEQAVLKANARIYEQAGARASQAGMGTTIVAAVARGEWLIIANVGDSRAYLVRNGIVQQLTHDHSWVAEQVTAGLLTDQQAQNHMYRNVVTRCLGHNPQIEVDTLEQVLEPGDAVLLCSDGLSNQVSEDELIRVIAQQAPPEAVAELIELANRYGGPDNITAILIMLQAEPSQTEPSEAVTVVAGPRPEPQIVQVPPARAVTPAVPPEKSVPARRSVSPLLKWGVPLALVLFASCIVGIALTVWGPEVLQGWFITSTATPTVEVAPTTTETPDATATATVPATAAPSPTWTATASPSATPTPAVTPTSTATSTPTVTPTASPTSTPLPSTTPQIEGP
jgi:serine/threonine protein phosphatase PrpC